MAKKYDVISPDGFPITFEPFESRRAAQEFIPKWCQRYEVQGYYSTSQWKHIPLEDLPNRLTIVSVMVDD